MIRTKRKNKSVPVQTLNDETNFIFLIANGKPVCTVPGL